MLSPLQSLLQFQVADREGIYDGQTDRCSAQSVEIVLRERIAGEQYDDYLGALSNSHSIPVMDYEVDRFLAKMPPGALILDIGGCWGWHWRRLARSRPDVGVLIVDFVRANLAHARNVLGELVGNQVGLMHADATELPSYRSRLMTASAVSMACGRCRLFSTFPVMKKRWQRLAG